MIPCQQVPRIEDPLLGAPIGPSRRLEALAAYRLVEQAVARAFGISEQDLRAPTRRQAAVARARQVVMYLAHVAGGLSLTETGRLAGRDRTTAAHACRTIEDNRDDPHFDRCLSLIEVALRAAFAAPIGPRTLAQ